ncbi:hypothetical protein ACLOJK_004839 [Asimina triloba]
MYYTSAFCVRLGYGAVASPFDRHSPAAEETHLAGGRHLSITGSRGDAPRRRQAPLDHRQQRRRTSQAPPDRRLQRRRTSQAPPDRRQQRRRTSRSPAAETHLPIVFLASVAGSKDAPPGSGSSSSPPSQAAEPETHLPAPDRLPRLRRRRLFSALLPRSSKPQLCFLLCFILIYRSSLSSPLPSPLLPTDGDGPMQPAGPWLAPAGPSSAAARWALASSC